MTCLLANQVGILLNPHDGCKRQGTFVQCLKEVSKDHDSQHTAIDQLPKPLIGGLVNNSPDFASIFGNLSIDLREVSVVFASISTGLHPLELNFLGIRCLVR
jgi:hypothetical protein